MGKGQRRVQKIPVQGSDQSYRIRMFKGKNPRKTSKKGEDRKAGSDVKQKTEIWQDKKGIKAAWIRGRMTSGPKFWSTVQEP